jgi:hypothetical protein
MVVERECSPGGILPTATWPSQPFSVRPGGDSNPTERDPVSAKVIRIQSILNGGKITFLASFSCKRRGLFFLHFQEKLETKWVPPTLNCFGRADVEIVNGSDVRGSSLA